MRVLRVAERELAELLGNRRYMLAFGVQTLLLLLLLPAFGNLLAEGGASVPAPALQGFIPLGVVVYSQDAGLLLGELEQRRELRVYLYPSPPVEKLERGRLAGYLVVPAEYRESGGGGRVVLVLGGSLKAGMLEKAVREALSGVRGELLRRSGGGAGVELVRLFRREVVVQVEERRYSSFFLGYLIPLVLFFPLFMTGGAVIDSTTGEKLRGTLECLLASPVSRGEVVAGKFLALWGFASMQCALWLGVVLALRIPVAEPWSALLVLLGAAASLSSLSMLLGFLAGSHREANLALMLLYIPAFIGVLYTLTASFFTGFSPAYLPGVGVVRAVSGGAQVLPALLPQLLLAFIALFACRWALGREELLAGSRPAFRGMLEEAALRGTPTRAGAHLGLLFSPAGFILAVGVELVAAFAALRLLPHSLGIPALVLASAATEEAVKLIPVLLMLRWRPSGAKGVLACAAASALGFFAIETAVALAGAAVLGGAASAYAVAYGRGATLAMHLLATTTAALGLVLGGRSRGVLLFLAGVGVHAAFNLAILGGGAWV